MFDVQILFKYGNVLKFRTKSITISKRDNKVVDYLGRI